MANFARPRWIRIACIATLALATALASCSKHKSTGGDGALTGPIAAAPNFLDQGAQWGDAQRQAFYLQDQGSQLIPLAWLKALKAEDGKPFLADQLARFGYLPNPANANGLPVGFTVNNGHDGPVAGMSCAACHTRQIVVDGKDYRIDGGPALSDFQALLTSLVGAVGKVLSSDTQFNTFADAVLGPGADTARRQALRGAVELWHTRELAMIEGALPRAGMWGLGRLDAVSMIFNRLSGLDIGPPPTYLIKANIQPADAPVRYPFVWNAARQDKTQWPGFADNGDNLLGLARNLGEVYGVFATLHPSKLPLDKVNFAGNNSANFNGLAKLENLIVRIGAPKYPWPVDQALKARGEALFDANCAACHGERRGKPRLFNPLGTWATPIQDVGTDGHEHAILLREVDSGVLTGGKLLAIDQPIPAKAKVFKLLGFSVIGSILQGGLVRAGPEMSKESHLQADLPKLNSALQGAYALPQGGTDNSPTGFESRVLKGIWAAGPYLHNGSVPTLADLLKPSKDRPATFKVGRNYDIRALGLAGDQPGSTYMRTTTDCASRNSGDSRCGHEDTATDKRFGTSLSEADKLALLEYLKTL